jgi:hypothetical protein
MIRVLEIIIESERMIGKKIEGFVNGAGQTVKRGAFG